MPVITHATVGGGRGRVGPRGMAWDGVGWRGTAWDGVGPAGTRGDAWGWRASDGTCVAGSVGVT